MNLSKLFPWKYKVMKQTISIILWFYLSTLNLRSLSQTWCPYYRCFFYIFFTCILGEFSMYFLIWNINFLEVAWKLNFLENFLRNFLGISKPKLEQGIFAALVWLGAVVFGKHSCRRKTHNIRTKTFKPVRETNNYCLGATPHHLFREFILDKMIHFQFVCEVLNLWAKAVTVK